MTDVLWWVLIPGNIYLCSSAWNGVYIDNITFTCHVTRQIHKNELLCLWISDNTHHCPILSLQWLLCATYCNTLWQHETAPQNLAQPVFYYVIPRLGGCCIKRYTPSCVQVTDRPDLKCKRLQHHRLYTAETGNVPQLMKEVYRM